MKTRGFRSSLLSSSPPPIAEVGVDNSYLSNEENVASLADWFNLLLNEYLDGEDAPKGAPIPWLTDAAVLSQARASIVSNASEGHLPSPHGQLERGFSARLGLDFTSAETVIEIENQEYCFLRSPHSPGVDEHTQVLGNGHPRDFAGRIGRAWYVEEGRALAFVTNKSEYYVLTKAELISFGTHNVGGPGFSLATPSFVSSQRRLFMVLKHGEILEVSKGNPVKSHHLTVFPPNLWEEIDLLSRTMTPQDLSEGDYKTEMFRLQEPSLDRDLAQMARALKATSTSGRVLLSLIDQGARTVRDIFEGDPDRLFPGANQRWKSKKVASGIVAEEIRRSLRADDSGREQELLLADFYGRGWPEVESSNSGTINSPQKSWAGDFKLANYVSKFRNLALPVKEVRASRSSSNNLELVLPSQLVVTIDSAMNAISVSVPFWNGNFGATGSMGGKSAPTRYGQNTIGLLRIYAQALLPKGSHELTSPSGLEAIRLGTQGARISGSQAVSRYKRAGKVDYVALLKSEATQHSDLPEATIRNLEILRLRSEGMTLEEIGSRFGLTREAIRQTISKHGGSGFKTYVEECKSQRLNTDADYVRSIREYVEVHPGITLDEIAQVFNEAPTLITNSLTKYQRKLVSGVKPSRDRAQLWSDEAILEALQLAQTYHYPLTTSGYQELIEVGEIHGPSVPLVTTRFKTWKLACIEAGVEYVESLTTYSVIWSREDLIDVVCQYLQDPTTTGSVNDYDHWRATSSDRLPSRAQLRIVVGRWSEVCDEALGTIRSSSWDA